MSPAQIRLQGLRAEIERDLREMKRQLERAKSVEPAKGEPEAALVALSLDHAYQVLEQILLTVERALRLPERVGDRWHRALLADAARPLVGVRPPMVAPEAEPEWEHLLGFRHFLRHAYAANLDPEKLARNRERLVHAVSLTEPLLLDAIAVLDPLAK